MLSINLNALMAGSYKVLNSGVRVLNMDSSAYVTEKGLIAELFLLAFYGISIAVYILELYKFWGI